MEKEMRNKVKVGHNSKSYNDKHPFNPAVMKPIRKAVELTPRVVLPLGNKILNHKIIRKLYALGALAKPRILAEIRKLI